eukprot:6464460-Amphidinium_carterae.1
MPLTFHELATEGFIPPLGNKAELLEERSESPDDRRIFPQALWIPGILHIMDGVLDEAVSALQQKDTFLASVHAFVNFFKYEHLRDLFTHTCMTSTDMVHKALFQSFPATFIEWRWNSLIDACNAIVSLQPALLLFWDAHALTQKGTQAVAEDGLEKKSGGSDDTLPRIQALDKTIADPVFWAYCHMIVLVGRVLKAFTSWAEG